MVRLHSADTAITQKQAISFSREFEDPGLFLWVCRNGVAICLSINQEGGWRKGALQLGQVSSWSNLFSLISHGSRHSLWKEWLHVVVINSPFVAVNPSIQIEHSPSSGKVRGLIWREIASCSELLDSLWGAVWRATMVSGSSGITWATANNFWVPQSSNKNPKVAMKCFKVILRKERLINANKCIINSHIVLLESPLKSKSFCKPMRLSFCGDLAIKVRSAPQFLCIKNT